MILKFRKTFSIIEEIEFKQTSINKTGERWAVDGTTGSPWPSSQICLFDHSVPVLSSQKHSGGADCYDTETFIRRNNVWSVFTSTCSIDLVWRTMSVHSFRHFYLCCFWFTLLSHPIWAFLILCEEQNNDGSISSKKIVPIWRTKVSTSTTMLYTTKSNNVRNLLFYFNNLMVSSYLVVLVSKLAR